LYFLKPVIADDQFKELKSGFPSVIAFASGAKHSKLSQNG